MKINRLILSAFGSFSGEEIIDFRGVQGELFLISGDTGAGKTTILDAISYALFEETSGRVRDGGMMRSQYADADTPTYVKLEFEYRGETYVVKRNPTYKRQSKRRNQDGNYALTEEKAGVELQLPDGTMYRGKKQEINRKIIEIIGITAKQFSSIVMIAQGKFTQLLFASSKERKEIFKELFDTEIYARIQDQLQEQAKTSTEKLKVFNMQYQAYMRGILLPDEYERASEWEAVLQYETMDRTELVEGMLEEIRQQSGQQAKKDREVQEAAKEQVAQIKVRLSQAEQELKWIRQREQLQKQLEELELQRPQEDEKVIRIHAAERARQVEPDYHAWQAKQQEQKQCVQELEATEQLRKQQEQIREQTALTVGQVKEEGMAASEQLTPEIRQLEENLQQYEQLQVLQTALQTDSRTMQELKQQQELTAAKQVETDTRIQRLKTQKQELSVLVNGYEAANQMEQAAGQRLDKVRQLRLLWRSREEEVAKETSYQTKLTAAEAEKRKTGEQYEQAMEHYIGNQAGVLAKQLRAGYPCPVCGSVEHPHPAAELAEDVSKEQLEHYKQVREAAEKNYQHCAEEIHVWQQALILKEQQLQKEGEELGLADWLKRETAESMLEETEDRARQELNARKEAKQQAEDAGKQLARFNKELPELEKKLQEYEQQIKRLETEGQTVHDRQIQLEAQISGLQKTLVFESMEEAKQELAKKMQALNAWTEKMQAGEARLQKLQTEINRLLGSLEAKRAEYKRLTGETEQRSVRYEQQLQQAGFESEAAFLESYMEEGALEKLRNAHDQYEQRGKDLRKEYEIVIREVGDKAPYELDSMREALKVAEEQEQLAEAAYQKSANRLNTNETQIRQLRSLQEQYRKEESEFRIYETLSKTANGRLNQSVKLDFQTYIQRYYFSEMIRAANERLVEMTGGRLYLQCRELKNLQTQGEAGLDLDIYSAELNQVRDVKTLSGGESFQAALAMAFGMADIIEKRVGRIQMGMLFIDEGFGSLDDDARQLAIEKLRSMTGKNQTVGIISHVAELRDEVEHLLYVKKDSHGSHAHWFK